MLSVKKLLTKLTQSASVSASYINGSSAAVANYDCNDATQGALFLSTGTTNGPTGFTWFVLITFSYYSGLKIQIAIDTNGNSSIRGWNGSSWSTWKRTANA